MPIDRPLRMTSVNAESWRVRTEIFPHSPPITQAGLCGLREHNSGCTGSIGWLDREGLVCLALEAAKVRESAKPEHFAIAFPLFQGVLQSSGRQKIALQTAPRPFFDPQMLQTTPWRLGFRLC